MTASRWIRSQLLVWGAPMRTNFLSAAVVPTVSQPFAVEEDSG